MAHTKGHKETWWEKFKKGLKEKIEVNAADLNFLPKKAKLPI